MKKIILSTLLLISCALLKGQTTRIVGDSVRIYQNGTNRYAELILQNKTMGMTGGFLQNRGNGRTWFAYALDSVYYSNRVLLFRRGPSTISFPILTPLDTTSIIATKNDLKSNSFDTTYQIKFSPVAFERRWVYSYSDPNYDYYNDSISIRGENGIANGKFWGRFDDSTGFFYPTLQRILNAYGSLDKRNVIQGNGNMLQWDSMGMLIRQRSYLSGGNDTIFSLNAGSRTTPYFIVRQSAGTEISGGSTNLNSGTLVVNDVNAQFNRPVRLGAGSEVQGIQNAIILRRSSPETPLYWIGTIITNDNTTGGVYPYPDSAGYVPLVIRWKNQAGYEKDKFKFYADGSFWIPYTPYVSAVSIDSLLAIKNGKMVKVLKSDIGGGGGGAVSSVFGRTGAVVAANGDYTWAQINKSTSSLADITTRNWSDLQNKPTTLGAAGITDAQPLDGDLTSIAAISSNGIPKRTGANTWSIATAGSDYAPPLTTPDNMVSVTPSTSAISLKNTFNALTSATSITVDLSLGPNYSLSLAHNAAISFTNAQAGNWFQIWVTQTAGGNTLTIAGQPVSINSTASSLSWVSGVYNGSAWVIGKNVSDPVNLASSSAITGVLPYTNGGIGLSSLGTANQMLRVNSGATALEYFTPSYLTGNQSISFAPTGDVTGSASGTTSLTPALTIGNNVVTYGKMQNVSATSRLMGRITAGSGSMEELTGTQATSLLDVFTTSVKGLVPAATGGNTTTQWLRKDGTWAVPPTGMTHSEAASTVLVSNGSGGVANGPFIKFFSGTLTLGDGDFDVPGVLNLHTAGAGSASIEAPTGGSTIIVLPQTNPSANQVMVSKGTSSPSEWMNLSVGDYVPTISSATNLDSYDATTYAIAYHRIADKVFITGTITVDPTTSGVAVTFSLSLPIASDFTSANTDGGGVAGIALNPLGTVSIDTSNDLITFNLPTTTTASSTLPFYIWYTVK